MKALKQFEMDIDERILELCDTFEQKSIAGEAVDCAEYTRYDCSDSHSYKLDSQFRLVTSPHDHLLCLCTTFHVW